MRECNVDLIVEKIKQRKKELGWSNKELSEKADVSEGTLNKILGTETKDPSISNILKMISALGLSEQYVFSSENVASSVQNELSTNEQQLLDDFRLLNDEGQAAAIGAVKAFTMLDQYKKSDKNVLVG